MGFKQSYAHKEYVFFVFAKLSHYCNSLPVYKTHVRNGTKCYSIELTTRALPCFTRLYQIFYLNKVKGVPANIYDLLTPEALAHLIMGDGSFVNGVLLLCTDSYSTQDVIKLQNVLIIRYNLLCSLRLHSGSYYRVAIDKKSIKALTLIVKPYMISSFLYKLGIDSHSLSHKQSHAVREADETVVNLPTFTPCQVDDVNLLRLAPYITGLIESSGSIAVHNVDSNAKKYRPKIIVVFSLADEPLAKKLASVTKAGTVYYKKNAGYVLWQIQKTEDVKKIINIINGYMRTPKIEALHRAIN